MHRKKIILAILIVILGVIFRIFLVEIINIPNFEAVTALSLLSGSFFGGIYTAIIPLSIIFVSDFHFGNTSIYFFTWSAFILIGILGTLIKANSSYYIFKITGMGFLSTLFFYLWTNFGWWLTFGMYEMTVGGLMQCYIAALPFLKNQIFSVLIFVPSFAILCPACAKLIAISGIRKLVYSRGSAVFDSQRVMEGRGLEMIKI